MLKARVFVVTGAAGRIGRAVAEAIIQQHGRVVLMDTDEARGESLATELGDKAALFVKSDATLAEEIDTAIRLAVDRFGEIHGAVHCAYPRPPSWGTRFEDLSAADLAEHLRLQLGGTIIFSQRILRQFREQEHGDLVLVSSIQGVRAPKFEHYSDTEMTSPIEYSASKAGVIAMTQWLAKYHANTGIRVNCVSPGGIRDGQPQAFTDRYRSSCMSKGLLEPEDVSGAVLFLLSGFARYITGQNIIVDDGWSL